MKYNRKYYLHKQVKKNGFNLSINRKTGKTIRIMDNQIDLAKNNKYIAELRDRYSYGVQLINPLMQ